MTISNRLHRLTQWRDILIASLTVTGVLLTVQKLGGLQPLELVAFDTMVRLRPDRGIDPRLLVVTITEADIRQLQRWPPSDQTVAQVLQRLQQHQPHVIGLDLFRDIPNPPGHTELVQQLQRDNVIAITFISANESERVDPPPTVPEERMGFSNVSLDSDGRVRRFLLFASDGKKAFTSFSLQLALAYLKAQGIEPQVTPTNEYQLGNTVLTKLKHNSGGYQTIDDRGYQLLLNYRSPKQVARTVTLTQVLTGKLDPSWVKDKIVLIGPTAISLKDLFFTPYSDNQEGHRQMPGVMVQAQKVSQILSAVNDGEPLFWFWSQWLEIPWIFAWGWVGGALGWTVRQPWVLGFGSILGLGVLGGMSFGIFTQSGWIPVAAPGLAFIVTGVSVVVYQMHQAWLQQQTVMKLLGQQTSPEIANALWQARDRLIESGILPWQTLTATVLFTDLKDFSSISEKKSPEALMDWLNQYLNAMTVEVQAHHGIVNKFTGDGMMAVFGVPVPRTRDTEIATDAQRAVNCALAMGDRLSQLNQTWQQQGLPTVQMRVGIYTGAVTVGSLGGTHRLEYGVVGDSVNIASRLENYEKHRHVGVCRILIAQETLTHLQDKFTVKHWGTFTLKGKQKKVDVFEVLNKA